MSSPGAAAADRVVADLLFEISFSGRRHALSLDGRSTVADLRDEVEAATGVRAAGQRLVGLPAGATDAAALAALPFRRAGGGAVKLMLMGTVDSEAAAFAAAAAAAAAAADAGDDDDGGGSDGDGDGGLGDPAVAALVAKRAALAPAVVAGFRPKRWTAVLDIDYTLIDHRSVVSRPLDMARPFLHEFLSIIYSCGWDIVVWSATSLSWAQLKMRDMGVLNSSAFRIAGFLHGGHMVQVPSERHGGTVLVKPLDVIWQMFPALTHPSTTLHVDDLRRNFLLNPRQGLKIHACRKLPVTRGADRELLHLSVYFSLIRRLPSLDGLRHSRWKATLRGHGYDVDTAGRDDAAAFLRALPPLDLPDDADAGGPGSGAGSGASGAGAGAGAGSSGGGGADTGSGSGGGGAGAGSGSGSGGGGAGAGSGSGSGGGGES
jgi:ubiquitin-like domain-containing CTD phosphatase 1